SGRCSTYRRAGSRPARQLVAAQVVEAVRRHEGRLTAQARGRLRRPADGQDAVDRLVAGDDRIGPVVSDDADLDAARQLRVLVVEVHRGDATDGRRGRVRVGPRLV